MIAQVNKKDYEALIRVFNAGGNNAKKGIKQAVNQTAKQARELMYAEATNTYVVKKKDFKKTDLKIKNASVSRVTAEITTNGGTIGLRKFKSRKNTKKGAAKAHVKKANTFKPLEKGGIKAFVATMASGHEGIFERTPGTNMRKKKKTAIKELFGPARPKMAAKSYEKVEDQVQSELKNQINIVIDQAMRGKV